MKIICAITAGGKAQRMGGITKAFITVDGERIIDKNINTLQKYFSEIIIISNQKDQFSEFTKFNIFSDIHQNIGPIAGLHTALTHCNSDAIFLVSSDMPFLSETIIQQLLLDFKTNKPQALIPKIENQLEPLHGIYQKSILSELEKYIEKQESYAMKDFLKTIQAKYFELEDTFDNRKSFCNINSIKDLDNSTGFL